MNDKPALEKPFVNETDEIFFISGGMMREKSFLLWIFFSTLKSRTMQHENDTIAHE
jgi:uncharacterized radical SAM superfamily protein